MKWYGNGKESGKIKDPESMMPEEKYNYIFEGTRFEGRPRSKWITDSLLGDIRTFLCGIENKEKFACKHPLGGGNLSVPILISTALEFVAKLYAGSTEYIWCISKDMSEELKEDWEKLNIDNLTNRLKEIIKNEGFRISDRATIASISKSRIGIDKYQIRKEEGKLNVYENYNATDNVRGFIKHFFPKKYQDIPYLLWDGIRNGLVHSFYPKSFNYQRGDRSSEEYIQFQFYVENRRKSSDIKKDEDTIRIRINVFELYSVLEKAIEDYLDELQHNETLQNKFIRAWSSIEKYTDKVDSNQSREVQGLLGYLD